ncbi:unnamed protein product [Arctogadus glacialis]
MVIITTKHVLKWSRSTGPSLGSDRDSNSSTLLPHAGSRLKGTQEQEIWSTARPYAGSHASVPATLLHGRILNAGQGRYQKEVVGEGGGGLGEAAGVWGDGRECTGLSAVSLHQTREEYVSQTHGSRRGGWREAEARLSVL